MLQKINLKLLNKFTFTHLYEGRSMNNVTNQILWNTGFNSHLNFFSRMLWFIFYLRPFIWPRFINEYYPCVRLGTDSKEISKNSVMCTETNVCHWDEFTGVLNNSNTLRLSNILEHLVLAKITIALLIMVDWPLNK